MTRSLVDSVKLPPAPPLNSASRFAEVLMDTHPESAWQPAEYGELGPLRLTAATAVGVATNRSVAASAREDKLALTMACQTDINTPLNLEGKSETFGKILFAKESTFAISQGNDLLCRVELPFDEDRWKCLYDASKAALRWGKPVLEPYRYSIRNFITVADFGLMEMPRSQYGKYDKITPSWKMSQYRDSNEENKSIDDFLTQRHLRLGRESGLYERKLMAANAKMQTVLARVFRESNTSFCLPRTRIKIKFRDDEAIYEGLRLLLRNRRVIEPLDGYGVYGLGSVNSLDILDKNNIGYKRLRNT